MLSLYFTRVLQADMEQLLSAQQLSVAAATAQDVDDNLSERMRALKTIANEMDAGLLNDHRALQTRLEQHPVFGMLFNGGIWVVDTHGIVIGDVPLSSHRLGISYVERDFVIEALKQGKSSISHPLIGKQLKSPLFVMTVPIRDAKGAVIGALAGVVNLWQPSFLDTLQNQPYGKTGGYLLVDPQSRQIITATDKQRIMEMLPAPGVNRYVDRNIAGYEGSSVLINALGEEQLASVKRIPTAGWYILLGTPTAEAFAPLRSLQHHMLLATLLLTLLTGALIWWTLHRQLTPLVATADAMTALAGAQQIPEPLAVSGRDEISQLVGSFNRLITTWKLREKELTESQLNLAITLDSIGDAVIATDASGRITRMNPMAERLTAWTLADAVGQPLVEVFHIVNASTRLTVADPVRKVMEHGEVVGLANHTVLLARNGHEYQIADSAAPIRNAEGEVVGVVLVFSDVTESYKTEAALKAAKTHLQATLDAIPDLMFEVDRQGHILGYHAHRSNSLAAPPEVFIGKRLADVLPGAAAAVCMQALDEAAEKSWSAGATYALTLPQGETWFELSVAAMPKDEGTQPHFVVLARDITERKQAEQALRISATAFESQQGMTISDAQRTILQVNQAFTAITGYSVQDTVGQNQRSFACDRHDRSFYAAMAKVLRKEGKWAGEVWTRRKTGEVYLVWLTISAVKDHAGVTTHYVDVFSDLTERVSALAQIDTLAFYDTLTHLPNRRLLLDRLDQALHVSTRDARKNALLLIDLDNFKTLNDTMGHNQGDLLLVEVAQRLKACIREGDTVARLASDEFVVMLEDLSEDDIEAATQAESLGEKILGLFTQGFALDSGLHHGTSSIGITLFGGNVFENADQPLKRAELAMFQAKSAGRNTLRFFDSQMQAEVTARATLEADLRQAVLQQQFVLYYQPQVIGSGRITGAEALVRWLHPVRGMVSPAEFIPPAEETGLILSIGQWVLESACKQLAAWAHDPAFADLSIAVNVSARQFQHSQFVDKVLSTLARTGAKPKLLKLELTESMLVNDVEQVIAKMGVLKARGVTFSLDDFGTGYSSLAYLKRLPLDQLKIDQGFVKNIVTDSNDAAIAKMVVALAESMGLSVIAEGVELQAQAEFLAHLGCHAYQGYFFSRPLLPEAFEVLVRTS